MKNMKKATLTVLLLSALTLVLGIGCANATTTKPTEPTTINFPSQITAVLNGTTAFGLTTSNLGSNLGSLVAHDPASVLAGNIPYLPVLKTSLYTGTTPYLTFTFTAPIQQVFASTFDTGGDISQNSYVFDITGTATATQKRLRNLPIISGNTVTLNLPRITEKQSGTSNDEEAFIVGNRYMVDFFVQTVAGDVGRLTVAFSVKDANVSVGDMTGIQIYGKTAAGAADYSLFLIDSERVFFLNQGGPINHVTPNAVAERVIRNGSTTTTFDTYETRYSNSEAVEAGEYMNLDELANPANGRTSNTVELNWTAVANATEYQIYTTDNSSLTADWVYVGTKAANPIDPLVAAVPESFNFNLFNYPIFQYRAVRIVPVNNIQLGGEAVIQLIDEVRPVTSMRDLDSSVNNYTIAGVFTGHLHDNAESEGEIISTGTKNLGAIVQPDQNPEAYQITNITGALNVVTTATNGAIMPLSAADVTILATERAFQLGTNAVGVLSNTNVLTVHVRVKCYLSPSGTITYTAGDSTVTGDISVTYRDMAGNLMISRNNSSASKNTGVVIFREL